MELSGRTVLVTGATGGLGQVLARAFSQAGASLILTGRRGELLGPLAGELGARAIVADLGDAGAVARLALEAGAVDVLIANAALPASGWFSELTPSQIDALLDVNLRAPLQLAHALLPAMQARRSGQLVFISSLSGRATSPGSSLYSATKFGLRGFALALRQDVRRDGVGVSVVMPGFISEVGMYADAGVKLPPGVGTVTPGAVAAATVNAVRRNRAEVTVAPLNLRIGAQIASVAPSLAAFGQRLAGGERVARRFAAAQADKRPG